MKLLKDKKNIIFKYAFFIGWALVVYLINHSFVLAPWTLILTLFLLIIFPGFALTRIFRIQSKDFFDQLMLDITLGFILTFVINFFSIILGLNINNLLIVYLMILAGLFVLSFSLDLIRTNDHSSLGLSDLNLRKYFTPRSLIYLLMFVLMLSVLTMVCLRGGLFKGGDALFHLSIIRKVVEGQALTVNNLSYVNSKIDIAYAFPLWHVFLGVLAKIMRADIFMIWREITLPLTILVFLTWYFLFRKILPTVELRILAFLIFIIFYFAGDVFLLTTLPIPHTLSQLVFLPLSVALALKYVFEKDSNYKLLLVLSLFLILTAVVHLTGYFYFLSIMIVFALVYAILGWRDENFKFTFKKILLSIFASFLIMLPFALLLQLKGQGVISTLFRSFGSKNYPQQLRYPFFTGFNLFAQYAYLGLPLVLLFVRKEKRFIFLIGLFLVTPIFYWESLRPYLNRILGYIFMKRLYGTISWSFILWALILGFLLVLADRLLSRIDKISKLIKYMIEFSLLILAVSLSWAQLKFNLMSHLYDKIYSQDIHFWLNQNYLWLIPVLTAVVIVIFIIQKYSHKLREFFAFSKIKNPFASFLLIFILVLLLAAPDLSNLSEQFRTNNFKLFYQPTKNQSFEKYALNYVGGRGAVNFIKKNIPPKSVFDVHGGYFYLPTLVDVQMPIYSSAANLKYQSLYQDDVNIEKRKKLLVSSTIEYLLVVQNSNKNIGKSLDQYPQYFKKIYDDNKAVIYQVDRTAIKDEVQKK